MSNSQTKDWLRAAADPEHWLTYAEALRHAAHAVKNCAGELWMKHMCVMPKEPDPPGQITLPSIDLEFLMSFSPLAIGQGPLMIIAINNGFYLLAGYAFENLIKGVLIGREKPEKVPDLVASWGGKRGHNLLWLADQAGMQLDTRERGLLNLLTKYTIHMGRYPTPLTAAEARAAKHEENEPEMLERIWQALMVEFRKVREKCGQAAPRF